MLGRVYCGLIRVCVIISNVSGTTALSKCRRVFQAVIHIAVQELCKMANAIVLPVTLGIAKPTTSFPLISSSSLDVSRNISLCITHLPVETSQQNCCSW